MSSGPGDGRDTVQDRQAIDLVSKSCVKGEGGKVMAQQQVSGGHVRGLATSVGPTPARVLSSGPGSMGEVNTGVASVVVMSVPRSGLSSTASGATIGSAVGQSNPAARTSVPVATATTTYHVPRGAAAVANIAAPRPGATALGRTAQGAAITHSSKWVHKTEGGSLVTGLRGLAPRTNNPAAAWLATTSAAAVRARVPPMASVASYAQTRTPCLTVTRPTVPPPTRLQVPGEPIKPVPPHIRLQPSQLPQPNPPPSQQVIERRAHQPSTTPTITVTTQAGLMPRLVVGPGVPNSPGSMAGGPSRPIQATVVGNPARTGSSAVVRPAVATPIPPVSRAATGPPTAGTLSLAVGTQVRPRLSAAGPSRLAASTIPAPRLIGTATRPASAPATVFSTSARLASPGPQGSVLSLHPSVVVSSASGIPMKPATARVVGPKVISQPIHPPASIQITQVPVGAVQAAAKLPSSVAPVIAQSPVTRTAPPPAGAPLSVDHTASVISTYNLPTTYVYDTGAPGAGAYQVTGVVTRPYPPPPALSAGASGTTTAYTVQTSAAAVLRPSGVVASSSSVKFNPVMVVDPSRSALPVHSSYIHEGLTTAVPETAPPPPPPPVVSKPSASPRPSILRKRDNEGQIFEAPCSAANTVCLLGASEVPLMEEALHGLLPHSSPFNCHLMGLFMPYMLQSPGANPSPMKIQKNLTPVLTSLASGTSPTAMTSASPAIGQTAPVSPPSPRRPDSRGGGGGNSSGGSTTISATSSPGLGEASEETPAKPDGLEEVAERPPPEMSPRKKPRKQQLTGNELHEPKFSEDEMEFISEDHVRKQVKEVPQPVLEPVEKPPAPLVPARRAGLTLLASYRHSWKSRHNHYTRYSDIRPKDERRPTVSELASQKEVLQKIEGWKVFLLSTQMEELSELEQHVFQQLTSRVKLAETKSSKDLEKEFNRVNELLKATLQRSKVTIDQLEEARSLIHKIFEHKPQITEIINRSANKRSQKKRDKL